MRRKQGGKHCGMDCKRRCFACQTCSNLCLVSGYYKGKLIQPNQHVCENKEKRMEFFMKKLMVFSPWVQYSFKSALHLYLLDLQYILVPNGSYDFLYSFLYFLCQVVKCNSINKSFKNSRKASYLMACHCDSIFLN